MKLKNLPNDIAIFPLSNAVFFPKTILPLNIFEERYIQLVNDCMKEEKLFGMIQPKNQKDKIPEIYQVGCLGKIVSFSETSDKRFLISLSGVTRFRVKKELQTQKLYRKFSVDYTEYAEDLETLNDDKIIYDKKKLIEKIETFFKRNNYSVEFKNILEFNFDQLVSTICMVAPFSIEEKQKLIEIVKMEDKLKTLEKIINFNLFDDQDNKTIQ